MSFFAEICTRIENNKKKGYEQDKNLSAEPAEVPSDYGAVGRARLKVKGYKSLCQESKL